MGRSQRLRLDDVRAVYRLVGECRDLAADAVAWRGHLFEGLFAIVGGHVGIGGENTAFWSPRAKPLRHCDAGRWTTEQQQRFLTYMSKAEFFGSPVYQAFQKLSGAVRTRSRRAIHPTSEWRRSADFNEFHRVSGLDEYVLSFWTDPTDENGLTDVLSIHRPLGDRPFQKRDVRLIDLVHSELGPMIGRQLASAADPSPGDLSPRVRQVLDALLEGEGEKQVAAKFGLSRATVSEYVGRIYRHFRVNSRSELMARWVRLARARQNGLGRP